jgi:hypothetical protein
MHVTRRIDACLNCGETREMAAHGLCFKCYRREDRADDRKFALTDPHNPGLRKEHKKMLRGFTNVMAGLSDLGVQKDDVLKIRRMLDPYVALITEFLRPASDRKELEGAVNSEPTLRTGSQFTGQQQLADENPNAGRKKDEAKYPKSAPLGTRKNAVKVALSVRRPTRPGRREKKP